MSQVVCQFITNIVKIRVIQSYSGEEMHSIGKIVCGVNYKGQLCHH